MLKKKVSSVRSQREVEGLFRRSFEALKGAIENINERLAEGKGISDEQTRLLKNAPKLIQVYQDREIAKEQVKVDLENISR